jgi:hypothetical protein
MTATAQIINLSCVRIASCTEILKLKIYNKIVWNYFAFVLPYIFGRQLHFARMYVISILNECRIEHDPEQSCFIHNSTVFKYNLGIASHCKRIHLCFRKFKSNILMLLLIKSLVRSVAKYFRYCQTVTMINVEGRTTTVTLNSRNLHHLYHFQTLYRR